MAHATNEGLGTAWHALATVWTVFKIRQAFNPKSAMKLFSLGDLEIRGYYERLVAAWHALGMAWTVFKMSQSLNPKNAMKPFSLAKTTTGDLEIQGYYERLRAIWHALGMAWTVFKISQALNPQIPHGKLMCLPQKREEFEEHAVKVKQLTKLPSDEDLLILYELYKQATEGPILMLSHLSCA